MILFSYYTDNQSRLQERRYQNETDSYSFQFIQFIAHMGAGLFNQHSYKKAYFMGLSSFPLKCKLQLMPARHRAHEDFSKELCFYYRSGRSSLSYFHKKFRDSKAHTPCPSSYPAKKSFYSCGPSHYQFL